MLDARTLQGSIESGPRSGYDGHKKRKGAKVHLAVDTLGHLLATPVSAANENERAHVEELLSNVQAATGESVEVAYVDSGYNGEQAAAVAQEQGVHLEVVSLPEAKKGFVLLPRRWGSNAFCLVGTLPQPGARLRTAFHHAGGLALCRLRHAHAHSTLRRKPLAGYLNMQDTV